jgi:hypothetical protein
MEHLVRVLNEHDRQTLAWLRSQFGDAAVQAAAHRIGSPARKPYVSQLCRELGCQAPAPGAGAPPAPAPTPVGRQALAAIRALLDPKGVRRQ